MGVKADEGADDGGDGADALLLAAVSANWIKGFGRRCHGPGATAFGDGVVVTAAVMMERPPLGVVVGGVVGLLPLAAGVVPAASDADHS